MKVLKYFLIFLLLLAMAVAIFLAIMTVNDYRPKDIETCLPYGKAAPVDKPDSVFNLVTWNIGYFGLGMKNDFFYDGGKMTRSDKNYYHECSRMALHHISSWTNADFIFFQEVDFNSKRSYAENQADSIATRLKDYEAIQAVNYKVLYVPVPVTNPLGKVESGLLTLSKFKSVENTRFAFPTGFIWPVGLFMLDRCFLLTRVPHPSGHDIVLINTHNEAFDDGSQRKKQMEVLRQTMLLEYSKGNYVVTGGDWNLNPVGYDAFNLKTGDTGKFIDPPIEEDFLPEGWQWVFDPMIPTNRNVDQPYFHGATPATIIDFFVVSPNIEVLEIKTENLGFQWSDHNPVRMKALFKSINRP